MKKAPEVVYKKKKDYTDREVVILTKTVEHEMEVYGHVDIPALSERLGRGIESVAAKLRSMGIKYEPRPKKIVAPRDGVIKDRAHSLTHADGQRVDYQRMPVNKNTEYNNSWKLWP